MVVGVESPHANTAAINGGFEENTMAILDCSGVKDARHVLEDKLSFLEAVRAACLISDSPTPPSWKIFDAIFKILRGSSSLELAMGSYQLLTDLDKHYPRIYLKRQPEPSSSLVGDLVEIKEAWSPFCVGPACGDPVREGTSAKSHQMDASSFCTLIEEICEAVKRKDSQLQIKSAENMLLFRYLVSALETDFLPRSILYKETLDWVLLRESLLSVILGSRRLNFKSLVRDCMFIILKRCCHQNETNLKDLKNTTTLSGSAKNAQDSDIALAFAATELERQTCSAIQMFLRLIMELDAIRQQADLHALTSRSDSLRIPVLEIILDELTYVKDHLSPFLEVFSDPRWKLEIILQYFSKYFPKITVRTRRSTEKPKDATFEDIVNYFSSSASTKATSQKVTPEDALLLLSHSFQAFLSLQCCSEKNSSTAGKIERSTLTQICNGLISAFENITKTYENLELTSFEKEALFTAAAILSQS